MRRSVARMGWYGVMTCVVAGALAWIFIHQRSENKNRLVEHRSASRDHEVRMIAFGDINLGRVVGQKILKGDIDFPFKNIREITDSFDIVFANLESQLSDQKGETQDPKYNLVFTGPPEGGKTLADFGITLVSTANNHAFDYGKRALFETIENLDENNIAHVGTQRAPEYLYDPVVCVVKGIRFAVFGVTALMNVRKGWQGNIAWADTSRLFPKIREIAPNVDVVIVSCHGGIEYAEAPAPNIKKFARECLAQGVMLFIGHHPHVTFGILREGKGYIVHSLGNFVFYQPQHFWTQLSYGIDVKFVKDSVTRIVSLRCIPIKAGMQPSVLSDTVLVLALKRRTQTLSNFPIVMTTEGINN
jgi:poly-gamma-glutamate capsule biosynthesis protein CapA/YwtB (metallophosphatase superfamily)